MYIALKILHVAAVVIFLGNLVTDILWKMHGDQTKDRCQRVLQLLGSPDSNPLLNHSDRCAAEP